MGGKLRKTNKKKSGQGLKMLESDVIPILELKYGSPLFAIAAHPLKPIIASGLANGYIFVTEYDPDKLLSYSYDVKEELRKAEMKKEVEEEEKEEEEEEKKKKQKIWKVQSISKEIPTDESLLLHLWKTRRHKGSVRSICFNAEGNEIFSVGSDNVIKRADTESGKVLKKTTIISNVKITKILKSQTHDILVAGDEAGNVRVFDSTTLKQKNVIQNVHEDAINSIVQLVNKSAYQFLSVGSTTLATWDVRKEKATIQSENQEDEVLSATLVDPTEGDTVCCGMGEGLVTIWKKSKNEYSDQLSRVKISKNESVDSIISTLNNDNCVWAGSSDGILSKINCKRGVVVETRIYSMNDEVSFLDIDYEYRLISAGMDKLKIWNLEDEVKDDKDLDLDLSDLDFKEEKKMKSEQEKQSVSDTYSQDEEGDDNKAANDDDDDDDDERLKQKRKQEKEDKENSKLLKKPKKLKKQHQVQKLSSKQLKNLQKHEHGIRQFSDL